MVKACISRTVNTRKFSADTGQKIIEVAGFFWCVNRIGPFRLSCVNDSKHLVVALASPPKSVSGEKLPEHALVCACIRDLMPFVKPCTRGINERNFSGNGISADTLFRGTTAGGLCQCSLQALKSFTHENV